MGMTPLTLIITQAKLKHWNSGDEECFDNESLAYDGGDDDHVSTAYNYNNSHATTAGIARQSALSLSRPDKLFLRLS